MGSNFFGPGERHIGPHLDDEQGRERRCARLRRAHRQEGVGLPHHSAARRSRSRLVGQRSWKDRTGNNVWSFTLTVDEQRGIVYMPVSGPGMNYYGGDRPGNNLFSNSTVALDALTGKLKWHFQNIRHEIWDYNLPPAPGLIDIRKDGKTIPALAQVGKSASCSS